MTVANNYEPVKYNGNGVTTEFTVDWRLESGNDFVVYQNIGGVESVVDPDDYTAFIKGEYYTDPDNPGNLIQRAYSGVIFDTAPAVGTVIVLTRSTPQEQDTPYKTSSGFPADRLEDDFDELTMMVQEMQQDIDRSIKVGVTSSTDPEELVNEVERVYESIDNIDAVADIDSAVTIVANNISDVNSVASNMSDVNTVAGISSDVSTVAGISSDVTSVVSNATDISTVAGDIANVNAVADDLTNVDTVATNMTDVSTVAGMSSEVSAVASIASDVTAVSDIAGSVTTVAAHTTEIGTVYTNIGDVIDVAGNETNINAVNANKSNIDAVAGNVSNINTVASNITDVNTVANISSSVETVADNTLDVQVVSGNITDVIKVAGNRTNINKVANNEHNVNTVATNVNDVIAVSGNITSVTAVANNATNINAVNANKTNIDAVAGNNTDISAVAADLTNIDAVAADLTNIDNASANAQLARDWAVKMDGMVASEDYSAKYYADQARQAAAGAVTDDVTINRNTDDELQAIGVIDNNGGNALKTWTGTLAQYNAIVTKDSNTLYNITDDNTAVAYQAYTKSEVDSLIEAIYPVGSIYIGTQSTCPLATIISGSTWELVSEGRVLQGSDSNHNAGTTIEAGLPNHTHSASSNETGAHTHTVGGSDSTTTNPRDGFDLEGNGLYYRTTNINTSSAGKHSHTITVGNVNNNNIYGNSTTVQPPAYVVNIWERTA